MLIYLPALAAIHFTATSALGALGVLASKAVRNLAREDRARPSV